MSLADFDLSRDLVIGGNPPSTSALIMALLRREGCHANLADAIATVYPDLVAEFRYRYWSGGGKMPGEPGYNPTFDDNLRPTDAG